MSLSDYREDKLGGIYDASIGHLIHKNLHNKIERNCTRLGQESELRTYFCTEDEKIINFIYENISKLDMGFPDLNHISIEIYIYTKNQGLLFESLERMSPSINKKEQDEKFQVQKTLFSKFTQTIEKKYNGTWITELILNLILNIIRYLCVEIISGDNKTEQWDKIISILPKCTDKMDTTENIFETAIVFFDSLKEVKLFNKIHSKTYANYVEFIKWIQSHEKIFINCRKSSYQCCFETTEQTKKFMLKLLEYYKKTRYPFTYFNFNFNVSTGEFTFLNLYANIWQKDFLGDNIINFDDKKNIPSQNILLILDEADMLLHPRWQQQYMERLTKFLSSKAFKMCSFHILVATHSPILLSDFPSQNVLYLQNQKLITKLTSTFGCNIYKLFIDSFFLEDGLIGEFAHRKINEIAKQLSDSSYVQMSLKDIEVIIDYIGDEILQRQLLYLYKKREHYSKISQKLSLDGIQDSINLLKKQRLELDNMIKRLENLKND